MKAAVRLGLLCLMLGPAPFLATVQGGGRALAQDSTVSRLQLGLSYRGRARPGILVLGVDGLDSVRTIIERDLFQSDRFEMHPVPDLTRAGQVDLPSLKSAGIDWVVEVLTAPVGVEVKLTSLATGLVMQDVTRPVDPAGVGDARLAIHRVSDEIVAWTGQGTGIAATRILVRLKRGTDDGIWRIDADGANLVRITRPGGIYLTPAWSPDGDHIAYTQVGDFVGSIWIRSLRTGTATLIPTTRTGVNYSEEFSPDGKSLAFARTAEGSTSLYVWDVSQGCCERPLTPGRERKLAESLSPTYSPDGRKIAYVTSAPGSVQIYAMDADGASPGPLVPFDPGVTGKSYNPEFAPNGTLLVFDRDISGNGRQVFTYEVGSGTVKQVTSDGRNENASWAPDSRHLVFKSTRGGSEQLYVFDLVTSTSRPLTTPGFAATYPAWSPALGATISRNGGPQ